MSRFLQKSERIKSLNYLPSKGYGQDGDMVVSKVSNLGVFFCIKSKGMWYTHTSMHPMNRMDETVLRKLKANNLTLKKLKNVGFDTDKFIVSNNGEINFRTGTQLVDDLDIPITNIDYKTAYCSLEGYSDKETCKANGGTWYYSENDSHDSISSTAENQLLTVSESVGKVDAEPTLLYDGSTLEIKRNTNYDDNWQTAATTDLLKLSYDSDNYCKITVDDSGVTTIATEDSDNLLGHLKLDADGAIHLDSVSGFINLIKNGNTADDAVFQIQDGGILSLSTNDSAGTGAHIKLDADGDIKLDAASSNCKIMKNAVEFGKFSTYTSSNLKLTSSSNYHLTLESQGTGDIVLDSNGDISLDSADGNFIAKKAGTEFSVANSAYAGMILHYGYWRHTDGTAGEDAIAISTTMTVLEAEAGNKIYTSFVAPPSGAVEIVLSCMLYGWSLSTGREVLFALSAADSFSEVNPMHTYDGNSWKNDDSDYEFINVHWVVTGLTAGTSYQYWVAADSSADYAYIYHGSTRTNLWHPPITIKTTALPGTITTGQ